MITTNEVHIISYPKHARGIIVKYVFYIISDPEVRIPLTWPLGTYGLPMPKAGCPKGTKVIWHEGTRYQDTEDAWGKNYWSNPYDLAGRVWKNDMEQKFCMKTLAKASEYSLAWPKGQYCILKKGPCPEGEFFFFFAIVILAIEVRILKLIKVAM